MGPGGVAVDPPGGPCGAALEPPSERPSALVSLRVPQAEPIILKEEM